MLPYKDENPTELTPVVTVGIIVLNVLAWLFVQGAGAPEPLARSVCQLGLIPGEVLHTVPPGTAVPLGEGLRCVLTADANWWTVVTSMFMHGGWLHLIGNMWFLWVFGNNIEDSMGHTRFVVFYLLSGVAAAATQDGQLGATNGHVYSAFGVYKFPQAKAAVIARVDVTHPQAGAIDKRTRYIAGVSYQLSPNWRLLGDWDYANYQTPALNATNYATRSQALFQTQFTF